MALANLLPVLWPFTTRCGGVQQRLIPTPAASDNELSELRGRPVLWSSRQVEVPRQRNALDAVAAQLSLLGRADSVLSNGTRRAVGRIMPRTRRPLTSSTCASAGGAPMDLSALTELDWLWGCGARNLGGRAE